MFDRLQAGKNAAVREFDRVIAESRMDPVGQPLYAFFEAAISRGDSDFRFGHLRSVYCRGQCNQGCTINTC